MNLTYFEQRAQITYNISPYDQRTFTGWLMLGERNTVIARKIGGRNHWQLCHNTDIIDIKPVEGR